MAAAAAAAWVVVPWVTAAWVAVAWVAAAVAAAAAASRSRSARMRSKTDPTIRPHCEVPPPRPPNVHIAMAVCAAWERYLKKED